jgi:L-asparaginase II
MFDMGNPLSEISRTKEQTMTATPLAELWRGPFLESVHFGHVAICNAAGDLVDGFGDPNLIILPRSSCKMIQALPLVESGAGKALTQAQLAFACASHDGAAIHTDMAQAWLRDLGLTDDDLRCGPQPPQDTAARHDLIRRGEQPCQIHNNCSGKHCGFLTFSKHLGADPEYLDIDHPVQKYIRTTFEELTDMDSPGYGIDGCSAPNFATSLSGLARAMASFAAPDATVRGQAQTALRQAMMAHPALVAGETRACTELMRAMNGRAAVKTGAEGVYTAILPEHGLGIALKITDGATRAAECAITALLVKFGLLDAAHPAAQKRMNAPELNRRGVHAATLRPAPSLV